MNVLVQQTLPARRVILHALPVAALLFVPLAVALAAPLPAATLTVNSLADPGDGTCDLSECTLREAVADATSGDTINFSVTGTINLTAGELLIEKDLTINGPGMNSLTIDGGYLSRVMQIYSHFDVDTMTSHPVAVDVSDLGIARGQEVMSGGGLFVNDESLGHLSAVVNLTRVRVRDSRAGAGGGIANFGTLSLDECLLDNNMATDFGGGMVNTGFLTLLRSTLAGNGTNNLPGGGLYDGGTTTISDSTLWHNSTGMQGGGVACVGCTLTITNSTLVDNTASTMGGGLANGDETQGGSVTLRYTTIARNQADSGGGVASIAGSGPPTLTTVEGTVIALNTAYTSHPDVDGAFDSQGYNLVGDATGGTGFTGTGDLAGDETNPIDPILGGHFDNGGETETITPRAGSPAIDAGGSAGCPAIDQRGYPRPRDGDRNGSVVCDIGAVEVNAASFVVNSLLDPGDGTCDTSECTLREAIQSSTAGDRITFGVTGTINLNAIEGELLIDKDLTISGPGPSWLILDGGAASRILQVVGSEDFSTYEPKGVAHLGLSGVTLQNGEAGVGEGGGAILMEAGYDRAIVAMDLTHCVVRGNHAGYGGGIRTSGTMSIADCVITGNTADEGAGIDNFGELTITRTTVSGNGSTGEAGGLRDNYTSTITDSTFSDNSAGTLGGGIWCINCTQTITNSTISGNSAGQSGGGIANGNLYNGGTVTLAYSTLTGNSAPTGGGIIAIDGSGFEPTITRLRGTVVAGNTGTTSHPDVEGTFISNGYNLIGDGTGGTGFTGTGDLVGTGATPIDALLGALSYGGGPTKTHNLLPGSPAIDAADDPSCPALDQRGWGRPRDGDASGGAVCDIGAVERQGTSLFLPLILRQFTDST